MLFCTVYSSLNDRLIVNLLHRSVNGQENLREGLGREGGRGGRREEGREGGRRKREGERRKGVEIPHLTAALPK